MKEQIVKAILDNIEAYGGYDQAASAISAMVEKEMEGLKRYIKLLEKALDESPCDPDTTSEYLKAWSEAQAFKQSHNI